MSKLGEELSVANCGYDKQRTNRRKHASNELNKSKREILFQEFSLKYKLIQFLLTSLTKLHN